VAQEVPALVVGPHPRGGAVVGRCWLVGEAGSGDHHIRVDGPEPRLGFHRAVQLSLSWHRGGRHTEEDVGPGALRRAAVADMAGDGQGSSRRR
jgi:hypothetical protein